MPDGSPSSTVISSSFAPKILKSKQSSNVVVTVGQVGEAEAPVPIPLTFIESLVLWPVILIMKA